MTIGIAYWVFWLIALVFGGYSGWTTPDNRRWFWGGNLLLLVMLGLIGWKLWPWN